MTGRRSKGGTNRQDDDWDGVLEAIQAALSTVLTSSWTSDYCYSLQGSLNVNQYLTAYGKKGWN
jgi:hypothetical protein